MNKLDFDSPSVNGFLNTIQSIISRMANNSAASKTWCITIVSAITVLVSKKDPALNNLVFIAIIPILLFAFLDSYYLGLERLFRSRYDNFIRKLYQDEVTVEDLLSVDPYHKKGELIKALMKAFFSFSIFPFYTTLLAMVLLAWQFIL